MVNNILFDDAINEINNAIDMITDLRSFGASSIIHNFNSIESIYDSIFSILDELMSQERTSKENDILNNTLTKVKNSLTILNVYETLSEDNKNIR
jgi:hypothetical protein